MSRYDAVDSYTYPNSSVLRNKADIRDQDELDAFEADATAVRSLELADQVIHGRFDLIHLRAVHRHLFQDVYDWAGELRTVDISKGESRFANFMQIERYLGGKLDQIARKDFLRNLAPADFVPKLAHYMSEINAVHPFREGNGRAQRAFCSQLATQEGYFVDFESVDRDQMYLVMIASFHGNEKGLANLLLHITSIIAD